MGSARALSAALSMASELSGSMRFSAGVPALSLESAAKTTFAADNQPFSVSLWLKPAALAKN